MISQAKKTSLRFIQSANIDYTPSRLAKKPSIEQVKQLVQSFGPGLLISDLLGLDPETVLSGRKFCCPKCGKEKCKVSKPDEGSGGCDGCDNKWGDWIGFVASVLGVIQSEASIRIANLYDPNGAALSRLPSSFVALKPKRADDIPLAADGYSSHPDELEIAGSAASFYLFIANRKKGCEPSAFEKVGMVLASWRPSQKVKFQRVVAIPVYGSKELSICNYQMYPPVAGSIATRRKNEDGEWVNVSEKKLIAFRKPAGQSKSDRCGVFLSKEHRELILAGKPVEGLRCITVEGESDLIAFIGILPADSNYLVWSNSDGAHSTNCSSWFVPMLQKLQPVEHIIIRDRDKAGLESNSKWSAILRRHAPTRVVELPLEYREKSGPDLRDFLCKFDAKSRFAEFEKLIASSSSLLEADDSLPAIESESTDDASDDNQDDGNRDAIVDPLERYSVDDPHRLARINLRNYGEKHNRTLRYWKQTWYRYRDGQYLQLDEDYLFARLTDSIEKEFERSYEDDKIKYAKWVESDEYDEATDKGPPKQRKTKLTLVRDVLSASKGLCILPASQSMHDWIGNEKKTDGVCIAVRNGILNLSKATATDVNYGINDVLLPHSPSWFSTSRLDFDFDPYAQCPNWIRFLNEVFNGDEESIDLLQKWFGYLLTPDNSLQKILFVIGKKRSGKGTIVQIMKSLFGEANIATPKLVSFTSDFGLQSLIDKKIGIIADARLPKKADEVAVMEALLSISGGDPQDIARKFKDTLSSYQLPIRFTIFSNEVPNLRDFSEAFVSRCMFLLMPNSYLGREDFGLQDRLRSELSGILNWAIIGRHKLNGSKYLIQPEMGKVLSQTLKSPVLRFCEERVEFTSNADDWVDVKVLFDAWSEWVEENSLDCLGTPQTFSKCLRAIEPALDALQYRKTSSERSRKFIRLKFKEQNK